MAKSKFLLFFLLVIVGCISPFALSLLLNRATEIDVIISWGPQTQYAGTLVAKEEKMFLAQGLRVSIDYTSSNKKVMELVSKGRKQIGVVWGHNFLVNYSETTSNAIVIAQIMPESSLMILARKSSGINKLSDLSGKKISVTQTGTNGFLKLAQAFLNENNILPAKLISQSFGMNPLLFGVSDAMLISDIGSFYSFYAAGIDTSEFIRFYLRDYGFYAPDNLIIVNKDFLTKYPKNVEKYLTALKQGWIFTTIPDNYPRTIKIIQKYSNIIKNNSTQEKDLYILRNISTSLKNKNNRIMKTFLDAAQFNKLENIYFRNKLISKKYTYDSLFTKKIINNLD